MEWLEKLMGGHAKRSERASDNALTTYKTKLKQLVYDDELVEELAPIFAKLHGAEGFDKVFELLETKEKQIAVISGGEWFEQQTDSEQQKHSDTKDDEKEEKPSLTAEQILEQKYSQK